MSYYVHCINEWVSGVSSHLKAACLDSTINASHQVTKIHHQGTTIHTDFCDFLESFKIIQPARLTIIFLWFLFFIVRRVPRPSVSGCKKFSGLKQYLLGHQFSWQRLSAILCPWNSPWWWFFSLKLNKKCLKTPSKIKGLSFISSNLGNMDFFLIFNCISH